MMKLPTNALRKIDAHQFEREEHEHYVEPRWVSERLFQEEEFNGAVWDPCCGFGHIVQSALNAKKTVTYSDIVDRGFLNTLVEDFFATDNRKVENIVCNPPFNIAPEFTTRAVSLAFGKVAIVFPTARLNAAHWVRHLPLLRVWLLTPRPSMPPGHTLLAGQKPGGGKMDFCWLVFERGFSGKPTIEWLRRDERGE